jgi:hypothetical protein
MSSVDEHVPVRLGLRAAVMCLCINAGCACSCIRGAATERLLIHTGF